MSCVTVLCPNGRRQMIKVTPNTSLLYVLEEVCKKQKFDPHRHQLRHYKKVLDLSLTIRFANIPNNGLLEMEASAEERIETKIKIGLQFESGHRMFDHFAASSSLYDVLSNWKNAVQEEMASSNFQPILIYMRKEMVGVDIMKKTTLRMLGLTSGNAILRLIFRKSDVIGNQAHEGDSFVSIPIKKEVQECTNVINADQLSTPINMNENDDFVKTKLECSSLQTSSSETNSESNFMDNKEYRNTACDDEMDIDDSHAAKNSSLNQCESSVNKFNIDEEMDSTKENIIILGNRDAMLFYLDDIKPISHDDLPDEFYDLKISDVKYLMKDLKQKCQELDDQPLMTSSMKESDKLSILNRYKKCFLRIQFPDRLVLQGTFRPLEPISAVNEFVKLYIKDDIKFDLFTTPPKSILQGQSRLFEVDLVPTAVVHFGSEDSHEHYLRDDIRQKVSTPHAVSKNAFISSNQAPSASDKKGEASSNKRQKEPDNSKFSKVPRWFKTK